MLKVLSYILCDLDPKVKVIGQKAGICDGVPSTSALVYNIIHTESSFPKTNMKLLVFLTYMLDTFMVYNERFSLAKTIDNRPLNFRVKKNMTIHAIVHCQVYTKLVPDKFL